MPAHRLGHAALLCATALWLGGCVDDHAPVTVGAPEHLHEALGGDESAQDWVSGCLARSGRCVGLASDPAMSCAWRGVRLSAPSPTRSLATVEAFAEACSGLDRTASQRAAAAFADLTTRVSHADLPELGASLEQVKAQAVLYPSAADVRARANRLLSRDRQPALAAFAPPVRSADHQTLTWTACSAQLCLDATGPAFGGGLVRYRVRSVGAYTPNAVAAVAAAALEAPFIAERTAGVGRLDRAGVCWTSTSAAGGFTVEAAPAPCAG